MREAIGGTWLTQLVIVFMLLFVAFLALSLNYTKAFKIKNELMTIIEKQEGFTSGDKGSIGIINNYLRSNGYSIKKTCPENSYGVENLNQPTAEKVTNRTKKYHYCVSKINAASNIYSGKVYYKVNVFFYFNLPVIGDIFTFNISGTTNDIVNPADKLEKIQG